jgi:hypothetical protein
MPDNGAAGQLLGSWIDKLEIREVIERSMRYTDDQDGECLAALFDEDGVLQLAGTVFRGREAIGAMFRRPPLPRWKEPGGLLLQPGAMHRGSNPVIEVSGNEAAAETDLLVIARDADGRARITLAARYRDRLRRADGGQWLIASRTGVSLARPGEEGTDAEWARALARMPGPVRDSFRAS